MTKKNILWIALAVAFLAALMVFGNILTEKLQEKSPPVVVPADTQVTEKTEPTETASSQETENSSEELPSESHNSGSTEEIASSQTASQESSPRPTAPPTTPPTSGEDEDLLARIDALVTEVYGLKDYYIAQLAYLESAVLAEYEALPAEQQTPEKRKKMALDCIDQAYALENECDSRMDEICSELSHLLLKTDGRMNLVNDIRYAYAKEKEQAKSQFLEKYADYFD